MRLSMCDVLSGNQNLRNWYSGEPQPRTCQTSSSGRDHAPAVLRNRAHEFDCAGHHDDAIAVIRFAAFQLPHLRLRVKMRSDRANYFDGANAVRDRHNLISVNSLLAGPDPPLPLHRARGIDKNAIEIDENCRAKEGSSH